MSRRLKQRNGRSQPLIVKLLSSDSQLFTVAEPVARRSGVISAVLEDVGARDPIPLLNVTATVLKKVGRRLPRQVKKVSDDRTHNIQVIEYCEYHQNDPMPPPDGEWNSGTTDLSVRRKIVISDWDAEYIDCEQELLFEIIQAASYLDIKTLL